MSCPLSSCLVLVVAGSAEHAREIWNDVAILLDWSTWMATSFLNSTWEVFKGCASRALLYALLDLTGFIHSEKRNKLTLFQSCVSDWLTAWGESVVGMRGDLICNNTFVERASTLYSRPIWNCQDKILSEFLKVLYVAWMNLSWRSTVEWIKEFPSPSMWNKHVWQRLAPFKTAAFVISVKSSRFSRCAIQRFVSIVTIGTEQFSQ
jgi:hypothetical protein